jgi:hypothetical protein
LFSNLLGNPLVRFGGTAHPEISLGLPNKNFVVAVDFSEMNRRINAGRK